MRWIPAFQTFAKHCGPILNKIAIVGSTVYMQLAAGQALTLRVLSIPDGATLDDMKDQIEEAYKNGT